MTAAVVPAALTAAPAGARRAHALRLAVVIVHYKTPGVLRDCIASLFPEIIAPGGKAGVGSTGFGLPGTQAEACTMYAGEDHVFVVDNASGAEQLAQLAAIRDNAAITLIESPHNLGFAGANNLAIKHIIEAGGADFYLLLNPDTVIRRGAIATLLAFLDVHPGAACVGPRLEDADGTAQQSAFTRPTPFSEFLRGASIGPLSRWFKRFQVYGPIQQHAVRADWLSGACILMRSGMLEKTGLLDERFFMYFEEVDFFGRAERLGFETWYEPAAHVVHLVGQSSGIAVAAGQKRLPGYWFESRHRYFRKHFGYAGMVLADIFWFNGYVLDRVRQLLTGRSHAALAQREAGDLLRHGLRQFLRPFGGGA